MSRPSPTLSSLQRSSLNGVTSPHSRSSGPHSEVSTAAAFELRPRQHPALVYTATSLRSGNCFVCPGWLKHAYEPAVLSPGGP